MNNHLTIVLAQDWLDGTSKPICCGYDPDGPNVQLERPDGTMALLNLRDIAEQLMIVLQTSI